MCFQPSFRCDLATMGTTIRIGESKFTNQIPYHACKTATRYLIALLVLSVAPTTTVAWRILSPTTRGPVNACVNMPASDESTASVTISLADATLMPPPDRGKESTHAVYGFLMRDTGIERYDVYKLAHVTPNTTAGPIVIADVHIGTGLDGHRGVVHGGILALIIDDVLGFGFEALEVAMAYTANLSVNFRTPVPANTNLYVACTLMERTERKLVWNVTASSPDQQTLYCEVSSVYVIPRQVVEQGAT